MIWVRIGCTNVINAGSCLARIATLLQQYALIRWKREHQAFVVGRLSWF